jgi:hypothetical protein
MPGVTLYKLHKCHSTSRISTNKKNGTPKNVRDYPPANRQNFVCATGDPRNQQTTRAKLQQNPSKHNSNQILGGGQDR